MEKLKESHFSALTKYLTAIQHALQTKQSSVTINNDDVTLLKTTSIFGISHSSSLECKPLPDEIRKLFQTIPYTQPDVQKLIETDLVKSGMLLARGLVPRIHSFLVLLTEMFPVFKNGFGEEKIRSLTTSIHENFKVILRWKDHQLIAKELSSITDVDCMNAVTSGVSNMQDDLMIDQAIQDLGRLSEQGMFGMNFLFCVHIVDRIGGCGGSFLISAQVLKLCKINLL